MTIDPGLARAGRAARMPARILRAMGLGRPAAAPRAGEVTLVEDEDLVIRLAPGRSDRLVLAFTGIEFGLGGLPMAEFAGTAAGAGPIAGEASGGNHVMFVSDMKRGWFSGAGLCARIAATVTDYAAARGIRRIDTIGNSMGAYGAIRLAGCLPVRSAVAFAPQVSMDPAVIDERRWSGFRTGFGPELLPSLNGVIAARPDTRFHAFFGWDDRPDRRQAALLAPASNLSVHRLAYCGHDAAGCLKRRGLLRDAARAALAGDTVRLNEILGPLSPGGPIAADFRRQAGSAPSMERRPT